jgi:hypothetical protein
MCKEAQAAKDSGRKLSPLDFRFHFFPWHGHKAYRISSENFDLSPHMQGYFSQLEGTLSQRLEDAQKAWYVKRSETQGEDMKREFPSTPEEAFEASNEGLYYGRQIVEARQQGRIRRIYYDANVPVHTVWDLGYNDSTAIWWYQICSQEIHLLEYYENSGEPLTHYLQLVKSKPYTYGKHIVPHDAAVHEYSTGLSRVEVARNHGIAFTIAPDLALIDGINAARNLLNRCWFDEVKCDSGIKALEGYRKEWNDRYGCWGSKPLHSFASHGADAFRMMSVSLSKLNNKGLTANEWKQLRNEYMFN